MKEPVPSKTKSKKVELPETPSPWQKYANAILIPIVIGLAVFLLVRWKMDANAAEKLATQYKLTSVRSRIYALKEIEFGYMSQEAIANLRTQRYKETEQLIDELLATAKDPTVRAETLVAKGDLNWAIANFPNLPGATTRPTLNPPQPTDKLLANAESAYNEVLSSYANQPLAAGTAKLGLAAVAQNRGQFDQADKLLEQVENDPNAPESFKTQAKAQRELTRNIRKPLYIAPTTEPATTDVESTTKPTSQPTAMNAQDLAATVLVPPATKPTTQPAK